MSTEATSAAAPGGNGAERIPLTLLTGYLGSGKTTLLSRLLADPGMARTAVVVNEFGDVDLDHDLIEASSEDTVSLASGCLCCTIRGSLADTLLDLDRRRGAGAVDFARVVVETSGLADPVPVLRLLIGEAQVAARYAVDGVVTVIDAVNGLAQIDRHPESVRQASLADALVIAKTDIAVAKAVGALEARLRRLNPVAPIFRVVKGAIEPASLFGLARRALPLGDVEDIHHDARIRTFGFRFEAPLDAHAYRRLTRAIETLRGPNLLRVKGILALVGEADPVAIHAVQDVVHRPERLARRLHGGAASRVVFITLDIPKERVAELIGAAR